MKLVLAVLRSGWDSWPAVYSAESNLEIGNQPTKDFLPCPLIPHPFQSSTSKQHEAPHNHDHQAMSALPKLPNGKHRAAAISGGRGWQPPKARTPSAKKLPKAEWDSRVANMS
jgi:hypothetical protein